MAEYTEEDLARELAEEMKREEDSQMREQQASAAAAQTMNVDGQEVAMPTGPKRRAPPRRKTGSNQLQNYSNTEEKQDDE